MRRFWVACGQGGRNSAANDSSAAKYLESGKALHAKGDYDGAIADYTKAIELDPKLADAYDKRGTSRDAKGDYDGAIADYTKTIALDPRHARAYAERGLVKLDQGRAADAQRDFDAALEIDRSVGNRIDKKSSQIKQSRTTANP